MLPVSSGSCTAVCTPGWHPYSCNFVVSRPISICVSILESFFFQVDHFHMHECIVLRKIYDVYKSLYGLAKFKR